MIDYLKLEWLALTVPAIAMILNTKILSTLLFHRRNLHISAYIMALAVMGLSISGFTIYILDATSSASLGAIKFYHVLVALMAGTAPLVSSVRGNSDGMRIFSKVILACFIPVAVIILFTGTVISGVDEQDRHLTNIAGNGYHYIFSLYVLVGLLSSVFYESVTNLNFENNQKLNLIYRDFDSYTAQHKDYKVSKLFGRLALLYGTFTIFVVVLNFFDVAIHIPWLICFGSTILFWISVNHSNLAAITKLSAILHIAPDYEYAKNIDKCRREIEQFAMTKPENVEEVTAKQLIEKITTYTVLYYIREYPNINWVSRVTSYSITTIQKEIAKLKVLGYRDLIP